MSRHTKTTTRLNVQIFQAEEALDKIVNLSTWNPALNECINTIQLVLKVCEHKMLRLEELEAEISRLRAVAELYETLKENDLVDHCATLESELEAAKRRIEELEGARASLQETGTD